MTGTFADAQDTGLLRLTLIGRGSENRKHFSSVIDLRPIFDAFKSFSPDATERLKKKREAVRKVYIIVPPHTELTNFFYFLI